MVHAVNGQSQELDGRLHAICGGEKVIISSERQEQDAISCATAAHVTT